MKVLGIETSCDETAVCLIEAEGAFGPDFSFKVLGNALFSQVALHAQYGGVYPNLAKREHAKNLVPLLQQALTAAEELKPSDSPTEGALLMPLKEMLEREPELFHALAEFALRYKKPDIDAIAVTVGPGLEPALWVGINFARALAHLWKVPVVAVNHMEGHVIMPMIDAADSEQLTADSKVPASFKLQAISFPVLSLLISGGHTELVLSAAFQKYERIGQTRDDAAGEAFDKVARLMDLPYPGGPEISRLAAEARSQNIEADFKFTRPMLKEDNYDFSFSGLKTAVRKMVEAHQPLSNEMRLKIAREFEDTVADVLIEKTLRAAEEYGVQTIVIGGGVSANEYIRAELSRKVSAVNCQLLVPPPDLATDNAIMIALAGYFRALNKEFAETPAMKATGNLRLESTT
jgi:N6-L-threonylcarbamoyladenine synthase